MNTDKLSDTQRKFLVAHEKMHAEFAALCKARTTQHYAAAMDAFYEWEERTGNTTLSDRDRELWCDGYVQAIEWQSNDN